MTDSKWQTGLATALKGGMKLDMLLATVLMPMTELEEQEFRSALSINDGDRAMSGPLSVKIVESFVNDEQQRFIAVEVDADGADACAWLLRQLKK